MNSFLFPNQQNFCSKLFQFPLPFIFHQLLISKIARALKKSPSLNLHCELLFCCAQSSISIYHSVAISKRIKTMEEIGSIHFRWKIHLIRHAIVVIVGNCKKRPFCMRLTWILIQNANKSRFEWNDHTKKFAYTPVKIQLKRVVYSITLNLEIAIQYTFTVERKARRELCNC